MFDFIGLRHIGLPAKNLAKMAEFYRDVLGTRHPLIGCEWLSAADLTTTQSKPRSLSGIPAS